MPSEERFISFDFKEIYKAIVIKCTRDELDMPPPGSIYKVEVKQQGDNETDSMIHIGIKSSKSNKLEKIRVDRQFFAQALVFYCQGSGIPLPRGGQKTLLFASDKVVMRVIMDGGVSEVTLPKEQIMDKLRRTRPDGAAPVANKRQDLPAKADAAKKAVKAAAKGKASKTVKATEKA